MPEIRYEERFVAFVDILGWKRTITKSARDPRTLDGVAAALECMRVPVRRGKDAIEYPDTVYSVVATQFSDSIVLSDRVTQYGPYGLVRAVQALCWSLLVAGHRTRGAIVKGDLHHVGPDVLGPALIDAYLLESNVAVYPRIVLDATVKEALRDNYTPHSVAPWYREDFDGVPHLHLVDIMFLTALNGPMTRFTADIAAVLAAIRQEEDDPELPEREGIRAKSKWLEGYLQRLGAELGLGVL